MEQTASHIPWGTILTVATTIGGYLLALILIPSIVLRRREAAATLAWILIIVFLPYVGAILFFVIGRSRVRRRTRRRIHSRLALEREAAEQLPYRASNCSARGLPALAGDDLVGKISGVAQCVAQSPPLSGNQADVFIRTDEAYQSMAQAISGAKHHVHMMCYIFRDDGAGLRFRDLLVARARDGLEVRLLVDAVGSHALGSDFLQPLLEAGGKFGKFMPVFPFGAAWRPNLRNHRKILVVDGQIGFAGGLNVGDEYQGRKMRYAPWRDTHMRVEGPAVWRLQEIFAEDWFFTTGEDLVDPMHFPEIGQRGQEIVQVVDSGPDHANENIHAVFFTAITEADQRLFITTPYFIPDPAVLMALKTASWRGVDVRILLPGDSDLLLVQVAGRSYYRELLQAGVKLYEHRPGMLHAKTMVVDGKWSTVGSANMDIRSFRLNFEVNLLISGQTFAGRMEENFFRDISHARIITLETLKPMTTWSRLVESISRVLSPVL